jgi:hypothetical protein
MTTLKQYPHQSPDSIGRLVASCSTLCRGIEERLPSFPKEKGDFLVNSLGDALRHVELVLRVIDEESVDSSRKEDRKGFLKRFFAREEDGAGRNGQTEEVSVLPDFSISRQGLQGNVSTIPMSDLLSFLAFSKKTGVLWVDSSEENFLIGIVHGQLIHANSDRTPEGLRLGEILVGLGCLTRRQLERFISQLDTDQPVLGDKLIEAGMVSKEELQDALLYQIQQLFSRLLNTKHAMFRLREGLEVNLAHMVNLDINSLLLNSARDQDEASAHDQRSKARQQEWSTWQDDLSARLVTVDSLVEGQGQGQGDKAGDADAPKARKGARASGQDAGS